MTDRPTLRVVGPAPTEDDRDVNPELVAALLALLAQAEAGEIQALAYATDDGEDIVWGDWEERDAVYAVWNLRRYLDGALEEE